MQSGAAADRAGRASRNICNSQSFCGQESGAESLAVAAAAARPGEPGGGGEMVERVAGLLQVPAVITQGGG